MKRFSAAFLTTCLLVATSACFSSEKESSPSEADDLFRVAVNAEPKAADYLRSIGVPMHPSQPLIDPFGLMDLLEYKRAFLIADLSTRGLRLDAPGKGWSSTAAGFLAADEGTPPRPFQGSDADWDGLAHAFWTGPYRNAIIQYMGGEQILSFQPTFRVQVYRTSADYLNSVLPGSPPSKKGIDLVTVQPVPSKPGAILIHILDLGNPADLPKILQAVARGTAEGVLLCLSQEWPARPAHKEFSPALINAFMELSLTKEAKPFAEASVLRWMANVEGTQGTWFAQVIVDKTIQKARNISDKNRSATLHQVLFSVDGLSGDLGRILMGLSNLMNRGAPPSPSAGTFPATLVIDAAVLPLPKTPAFDELNDLLYELKDSTVFVAADKGDREAFKTLIKTLKEMPRRDLRVVPAVTRKEKNGPRVLDLSFLPNDSSKNGVKVFALNDTQVEGHPTVLPVFLEGKDSLPESLRLLIKTGELPRD